MVRRLVLGIVVACGVAVPAGAESLVLRAAPRANPRPLVPVGGACNAGPGCSVLPPPTGTYRGLDRSVRVAFTLANARGSSLVIRSFHFANRCRHGDTRVTHEINVGPHYRFRFSSLGGITIRGSFVRGGFTGSLFASGPSGLVRGIARLRSSHCASGAITFYASN
jgi:hypothetical protein